MLSVSVIPVDIGTAVRKQRVVIYARVSKRLDEQESSYELQVNELIKLVKANSNYELVCIYADKESGMATKNRPSFNQMMELARVGGIDIIYTKSVSRFGRNAIEVPQIIRELRGLGVSVIFDKENISTADFADEFLLNILSGVAEEESRQTSTNIRWSVGKRMSKGGNTTRRLYGYKIIKDEFHIVPEEAKIVKTIYDWYKNHVSYSDMINRLESSNIKSPAGNGGWNRSAIENILTNEKYCGDAFLGRKSVSLPSNQTTYGVANKYYVRNNHEGIISHELFNWVKEERVRRTKHHHRGLTQSSNPESSYFYSVDLNKFFRYKVELAKTTHPLPVLLSQGNGERRMFHYNRIVEGINLITKELSKKYSDIVNHYREIKDANSKSLNSDVVRLNKSINHLDLIEDRLGIYEQVSALQKQIHTIGNIEKSLKTLRANINSVNDGYSIEKVKRVYSNIYIDGLNVYLVINLTNSVIEYRKDLEIFINAKMPYILNYKTTEMTFNIVLG